MNRDELILSFQDIVSNLVKKYNNHKPDEDLQQVGMIGIIKCVDRCIRDNITDKEQIKAWCITSARNEILMEIYKEKIKLGDEDIPIEDYGEEDSTELMIYLEQVLTPKEREVFDLTLKGYSIDEISKKMKLTPIMCYKHLQKIKNKIIKN